MLKMFVIRYQLPNGKTWESEKLAYNAVEALGYFRKAARKMRINANVLGVREEGAFLSLDVVVG